MLIAVLVLITTICDITEGEFLEREEVYDNFDANKGYLKGFWRTVMKQNVECYIVPQQQYTYILDFTLKPKIQSM